MTERSYLETNLRTLFGDLVDDPAITEIVVNADGRMWVERSGDSTMQSTDTVLEARQALSLAHDVAGNAPISKDRPLAGSEFHIGGSLWRAQVVSPPTVEGGCAVALRRSVTTNIALTDLCNGVDLAALKSGSDTQAEKVFSLLDANDLYGFLEAAILAKWNIVFSGGTSSGKTTWLRACLDLVPHDERILTIEDVLELKPKHPNAISMRTSDAASSSDLLKACLRLRPDRIMMGELRGAEAFDFLSVINSGHPGAISTLHADSPEGALWRLANMVMQSGMGKDQSTIFEECRRAIHLIVQLEKVDGVRGPTAIQVFKDRPKPKVSAVPAVAS